MGIRFKEKEGSLQIQNHGKTIRERTDCKSVLILLIQLPTGCQNIVLQKEELIIAEIKEFISNRM